MRTVSFPERDVPLSLRRQVVALQDQAWPSDEPSGTAPWHDPELRPLSVLLLGDDTRVVAALDILSKEFTHRGTTYSASGISAMVTDPRVRGLGHGRRLAAAAREMMGAAGADLGVFTCDRTLQGFYEAAGWEHLPGSVLVGGTAEAAFPSDRFDKVTMGSFFSATAQRQRSDFVGARIELFPGEIDQLW